MISLLIASTMYCEGVIYYAKGRPTCIDRSPSRSVYVPKVIIPNRIKYKRYKPFIRFTDTRTSRERARDAQANFYADSKEDRRARNLEAIRRYNKAR